MGLETGILAKKVLQSNQLLNRRFAAIFGRNRSTVLGRKGNAHANCYHYLNFD